MACLTKPVPYLWPKSAIFPTLFMTRSKIGYLVYDCCSWHSYPKHNFWKGLCLSINLSCLKFLQFVKLWTVHSSDIQQTPPLTKMKNFWQISLQGVYKLLRSNEKAPQLSEEKIGGQIFRLSLPQTQDDVRKVTVSQKRINYVLLSL